MFNTGKTNPAAVQQIKDARANKMGQLTPKPKTVVRVTAGPVAQGSGIRIIKGYVGSGEDYEGYGGKKHRHFGEPPNIMRHLHDEHGWDDDDFGRAVAADPTESPQRFELTLRGHHRNEHPSQANGFHVRSADCVHMGGSAPCEHGPPKPLSERRLTPRKQSDVPDELPDDIKNMKLDKSNVPADHDNCHYDTCRDCDQTVHACTVNRGWNHQFARGQDNLHQAHPAYSNHAEGEWCQGCNDAVLDSHAPDELIGNTHTHFGGYEDNVGKDYTHAHRGPDAHTHAGDSVPDQLPEDIRDRKLDKSAADECPWCKEESADEAAHKMAAAHKSISPGEFAEKAVNEGTHSGLVSPKGDIYAEAGYAHHGAICNKAKIHHAYGALVRKHGWARLTGSERRNEQVGIEIKHNMGSRTREAVSDVAMYTEGHGGSVRWDCNHPNGDYHGGDDHSSLAHHLSRLQNSFAKGWLTKTPLCVCGHDQSKHVKWNGDSSGKTGACHGCFTLDWEHRKHRNVTSYHHFNADPHAVPAPTSNAEAAAKPARSARMTRLRPQLERLARDPGATPGEAAAARRMLEKGKGLWLRMQAKGFEGRPVSLRRTKRGFAFRKGWFDDALNGAMDSIKREQAELNYKWGRSGPHQHGLYEMHQHVPGGVSTPKFPKSQQHIHASDEAGTPLPGATVTGRPLRVPDRLPRSIRTVVITKSLSDWGNRSYSPEERAATEALPHNPSHVNSIMRHAARHVGPEDWKAGEAWHRGTHQTIEERTGGEPIHHEGVQIGRAPTREHIAQGISAMSPRQGWATGTLAFDKVHARETVGNSDNRGIGLGLSVRRARTALRGGGMGSGRTGKKTRALANAALIPTESHTDHTACDRELPIDIHADRVAHYGQAADHPVGLNLSGGRHEQHSNAYRVAAARMGKEPWALHFASWVSKRRQELGKNNSGVRATMANENSSGQPNVLQHTGLWPGSTRNPRLLMNSKTIWSKLPEGLRGEVKLGRMPRGSFARVAGAHAVYQPEKKKIDFGPGHLADTMDSGWPGHGVVKIKRLRAARDWTVAHEMGHHMHSTRHQAIGANDWHSLPKHEQDYLLGSVPKARYPIEQHGAEGLAEGYAHLFTNNGGMLKRNAPQAHAMLTAKLDNAKKYWKSQTIYGAHASLEKGAGRSLLPAESDTIITMTAKPQEAGND